MDNIDYEHIQKININVTKKLLKYISNEIQKENLLDEIQLFHNDFIDHKLAFDIWLSFDFVDKNGKSFIDKFLDEKSNTLTLDEMKILIERNKSNISLFEIIDIDKDFIHVIDLFHHKYYTLWEPDLSSALHIEDLIFGRIANLLGSVSFIGDINYLPISARDTFLKEALMDFNSLREEDNSLTITKYLKTNSIKLYSIYTNCIFEIMEMEEDITSIFYDELDEFQGYLKLKSKEVDVKTYISNLIDFFEYYLIDNDLSLYNLDEIDFNIFFHKAIKNSFILSMEDLNSYIATFKSYLGFLSNKDSFYKETYNSILDISKKRFQLIELFNDTAIPFKIDSNLCKILQGYLDDYSLLLTMDFDKFILYILNNPLKLTEKNKHINRKSLLEINNMLEFSIDVSKKTPNQKDFPVIDMFYDFAIALTFVSIENQTLSITENGSNYLRLKDEEKYTMFFDYIWSEDFISKVSNITNIDTLNQYKNDLVEFLSSLKESDSYKISEIIPNALIDQDFFFRYYVYLQYLGIIKYKLYPSYELSITSIGKIILDYLISKNMEKNECCVISLDSFKKIKQS